MHYIVFYYKSSLYPVKLFIKNQFWKFRFSITRFRYKQVRYNQNELYVYSMILDRIYYFYIKNSTFADGHPDFA
jgi:hypothetical protein